MKKITDLECFALEQIMRPYQNMLGWEKRLVELPCSIDEIPLLANKNPEWWEMVKNRISRCDFWFPNYIKHKIVTMLQSGGK